MAKVHAIGRPVNESERRAIKFLQEMFPDTWTVFHNFEVRLDRDVVEIDIALLAPHALFLVDVKGVHGTVHVYGPKWHPQGRQPYHSPLAKLRDHAKRVSSLIKETHAGVPGINKVHVHAAVLLTEENAVLVDTDGRDAPDVTDFKHSKKYFCNHGLVPDHRSTDILRHHKNIASALIGKAAPRTAPTSFGNWQVEERLGGTDRYTEFRAKHSLMGKSGGSARLRVYHMDPYASPEERKEEFAKIRNAFAAVAHMPSHPKVLAVKDLLETEEEDRLVLITDDLEGQALRLHIEKANFGLTFDQKLQVMRDVLSALDHAHRHEVIHRNLTPDAILVTASGGACVTAFDFARVGKNRQETIAHQIVDDLDETFLAPEFFDTQRPDPAQASIASDLYAVGLIFYQLLTGELPYSNVDEMLEADGVFPVAAEELNADLPQGVNEWLQKFCMFDPEDRYISAAVALQELQRMIQPQLSEDQVVPTAPEGEEPADLNELPQDYVLNGRYRVQRKLGQGAFGSVYKVFDAMADRVLVLKLITKDRQSVYERLTREYKTLTSLPEHPNVVRVIWADRLPDTEKTPFIVFEYVDALDVGDMIETDLSVEDAVKLITQAAEGLHHLHMHEVYHQDIKPSNLLWTEDGVRIIDFNVAVTVTMEQPGAGGTRRYLPPDYNFSTDPSNADRIDRDIYALGITLYECLTGGKYPFDDPSPKVGVKPRDPKTLPGCGDFSSALVNVVTKAVSPERKDRFASAEAFRASLAGIKRLRSVMSTADMGGEDASKAPPSLTTEKPNFNPYVSHLLTLYSQSKVSNAGTRGLDEIAKHTYVETFLDRRLKKDLLRGDFKLVVISGNAGDGKTAFIQQVEAFAEEKGAQIQRGSNGAVFKINDHVFQSNYDGSQDEGDEDNDSVLKKFFGPFTGSDTSVWPERQTRIVAINEGRLVDFLQEHEKEYPRLAELVDQGLQGAASADGVVVINLNLRSVVADTEEDQASILERLVGSMTQPALWQSCENCDLKNRCYARHNALTFQDAVGGPKVLERLKTLYTVTHLRGQLHITMRDLRSALAYMLVGTLDCDGIHELYRTKTEDSRNRILDGFYFNSWMGGRQGSEDRLIRLLREIDVAEVSNPVMDRSLGFMNTGSRSMSRYGFSDREEYDEDLLHVVQNSLPWDYASRRRRDLVERHRQYLAHVRRRFFFESRGEVWKTMLPYDHLEKFLLAVQHPDSENAGSVADLLRAINRGEGLTDPERVGNQLALRVRQVDKGTIRSYRLFDGSCFTQAPETQSSDIPYLEFLPQYLTLQYDSGDGHTARLRINLDMYEMLLRLNNGYLPSVEEREGFYLSMNVFKNILAAAPYNEVLLSENGFSFYRIRRDTSGVLSLNSLGERAEA